MPRRDDIHKILLIGSGFYMLHATMQANATQMSTDARGLAVSIFATALFIGHSIGGAMAPVFANRHPDALDGVILWDAYPATAGFANYPKPVWHIHRAHADGTPPPAFEAQRGKFPSSSHWVAIPGGIHMYFGSFTAGGYQEDWAPTITRAAQQAQVTRATIEALEKMVEREGLEPSTPAL